jgi:hypothetical protein
MCTVLAVTRRFSKELAKVVAEIDTVIGRGQRHPYISNHSSIDSMLFQLQHRSSAIPFIAECVGWRPLGSVSEYIYASVLHMNFTLFLLQGFLRGRLKNIVLLSCLLKNCCAKESLTSTCRETIVFPLGLQCSATTGKHHLSICESNAATTPGPSLEIQKSTLTLTHSSFSAGLTAKVG